MDFSSLVAPRLTEERKRIGLSQAEVAETCGISREMWGKYERGKAVLGSEVLFRFAAAGADIQYVVTGIRSGTVPALDTAERLLLENYRRCTPKAQANLVQTSALLAAGLAADATEKTPPKQVIQGSTQVFHHAPTGDIAGRDIVKKARR